jgi:hypothetical protein
MNDSDSEKVLIESFLRDIFTKLNIPVVTLNENIIKSKYNIDEELNSINAFLTYENGRMKIIHSGKLKPNSLLHELLHIILGKFKIDSPNDYNILINSILKEVKQNANDWEEY